MRELLEKICLEMGIALDGRQLDALVRYKELLLEWNEKMNLTAITDEREIAVKHFADCLSVLCIRDIGGKSVIDVGTGAGFPGLVLKIAVPDISLTLLDSLNKRITFLKAVCEKLGLDDVRCLHMRAEEGGREPDLREKFDICASRAVARLNVLAEYTLPFVKCGGELIALKGPSADEEISTAERAAAVLGGRIMTPESVHLPESELEHKIIVIKKCRNTPGKYPRNSGKIKASPL